MKNKEYLTEIEGAYAGVVKSINEKESNTTKKEISLVKSAIKHLKMAVEDIKKADSLIKTDDYKFYKSSIESVISADNGEAGLENMLKNMEDSV